MTEGPIQVVGSTRTSKRRILASVPWRRTPVVNQISIYLVDDADRTLSPGENDRICRAVHIGVAIVFPGILVPAQVDDEA